MIGKFLNKGKVLETVEQLEDDKSKNLGCLDGLIDGHICGWLTSEDESPCYYEVFVNNFLVRQGFADKYREDFKTSTKSGNVGFNIPVEDLIANEDIFFSERLEIFIRSDHKRIINNRLVLPNSLTNHLEHYKIAGIPFKEISHKMGGRSKGSVFGKVARFIGESFCYGLGFIAKPFVKSKYESMLKDY